MFLILNYNNQHTTFIVYAVLFHASWPFWFRARSKFFLRCVDLTNSLEFELYAERIIEYYNYKIVQTKWKHQWKCLSAPKTTFFLLKISSLHFLWQNSPNFFSFSNLVETEEVRSTKGNLYIHKVQLSNVLYI